jgi:hypothetical protein
MTEHRRRQTFHVIGDGVFAAFQQRQRLHGAEQRLRTVEKLPDFPVADLL